MQETLQAEGLVCFKYSRLVAADNTISFAKQRLQLLPDAQRRSYARARVQFHGHFDGHLSVHLAGRCVATTEAPLETPKARTRSGPRGGTEVPVGSQTPSSAVEAWLRSTTAELGESEASHVTQSSAPRLPASTHQWRKPLLKPKRTKSLDNNTVTNPLLYTSRFELTIAARRKIDPEENTVLLLLTIANNLQVRNIGAILCFVRKPPVLLSCVLMCSSCR